MSHFLRLTTLALIWRKLGEGWRWARNLPGSRKSPEKLIHASFAWHQSPKKLWQIIQPQPHYYRRFIINMMVGFGIVLLLFIFQDKPFIAGIEDEGIDKLMQIRQKIIPSLANKEIPPFVFLDIDDNTHQKWGMPMLTPRDRLLNLIQTAVQAEARLIIVDINLSCAIPMNGLMECTQLQRHQDDQALYDYFNNYAANCSLQSQKPCAPILLVRVFQSNSALSNIARPSFLDNAVEQSTPYVQWASVLFHRNYYDRMVRHWWLWQPACLEQQPTVIPSIELLAAALIRNGISQHEHFEQTLKPFQPQDCLGTPTTYLPPQQIQIGNLTVSNGLYGIRQRVMYSMPWLPHTPTHAQPENQSTQQPHENQSRLPYFLKDKTGQPILSILPAHLYATSPPAVSLEPLNGSIVVIGGSYKGGRDIHWTPLAEMPGPLILINAIHTLLEYGEIQPLPTWIKALTYFILVILMSGVLARFGYSQGSLILGLFVILVLIPASLFLFNYGIWLDFMLPLAIVMQLLPL
jgi:CHASE2 domain-containing sensor protein